MNAFLTQLISWHTSAMSAQLVLTQGADTIAFVPPTISQVNYCVHLMRTVREELSADLGSAAKIFLGTHL